MPIRACALAAALTLGLGSAAMAQGVIVDTPIGEIGVGVDPYTYRSPGYVYERDDVYVREPYAEPRRGSRADVDIFSGYAGPEALEDDYNNQTGINGN